MKMRVVIHIFILITIVSIFVIYNFTGDKVPKGKNQIVIVGNDTLGRNWDNLPSDSEIEESRYNVTYNNTDSENSDFEQGSSSSVNSEFDFKPTEFSDRVSQNQNNKETIITANGAEVVVGTY